MNPTCHLHLPVLRWNIEPTLKNVAMEYTTERWNREPTTVQKCRMIKCCGSKYIEFLSGFWLSVGWLRNSILTISRNTKFWQNYFKNFCEMPNKFREILVKFQINFAKFSFNYKIFSQKVNCLTEMHIFGWKCNILQ